MFFQINLIMSVVFCVIYTMASPSLKFNCLDGIRRFHKGKSNIFLIIVMIYMFFIRTLVEQNSVSDVSGYQRALLEANATPFFNLFDDIGGVRIEPGYKLLMKLFSYISLDINSFLFVHAIISQILLYKLLNKYSAHPLISLVVYSIVMFAPSVYILRQYLAMLIMFNGIDAIISRKWERFLLVAIVSISIHYVSIVFVPSYIIYGIKKKYTLFMVLIGSAAILFTGFKLLYYYFGETFFGGYDTYLFTDKYEGSNYTECIIMVCFMLVFLYFAKGKIFTSSYDKLFFICILLGCTICFSGVGLPLVGRLALYYNFVLVLLIPRTMSYIKNHLIRYSYATVVLCLLYYAFFNDENMFTYKLIF